MSDSQDKNSIPRCTKCRSELENIGGIWSCPTCRKEKDSSLSDLTAEDTGPLSSQDIQPRKSKVKILIIVCAIAVLIGILGAGCYFLFVGGGGIKDGTITSQEFKFKIEGIYAWEEIYPEEDVYMAFVTEDANGILLSYADIQPVIKEFKGKSTSDIAKEVEDYCEEVVAEGPQPATYSFLEFTIDSLPTFQCEFSMEEDSTDSAFITRLVTIVSPDSHPYDYVITASYPQGDTQEKNNVDNFVNGFRLLE